MWSLNPRDPDLDAIPSTGKNDNFAEEGFTLLPGGSVLVVDMVATPQSEHFVPATNIWVQDGPTPVSLTSPTDYPGGLTYGPAPVQTVGGVTYGPGPPGTYFPPGEIGPAILRPDGTRLRHRRRGRARPAHTAIYRPGATRRPAGNWTPGPTSRRVDDAGDASAALLAERQRAGRGRQRRALRVRRGEP